MVQQEHEEVEHEDLVRGSGSGSSSVENSAREDEAEEEVQAWQEVDLPQHLQSIDMAAAVALKELERGAMLERMRAAKRSRLGGW